MRWSRRGVGISQSKEGCRRNMSSESPTNNERQLNGCYAVRSWNYSI